jgi:hypothetical protein
VDPSPHTAFVVIDDDDVFSVTFEQETFVADWATTDNKEKAYCNPHYLRYT